MSNGIIIARRPDKRKKIHVNRVNLKRNSDRTLRSITSDGWFDEQAIFRIMVVCMV